MKHLKNTKGSALVITIILLMVVSVLGLAMLYSVSSEVKINKAIEESTVAKYLAQAGIEHALYLVENDDGTMEYPYSKELTLGDPSKVYKFSISKVGDLFKIDSMGKVMENGAVRQQTALKATVDKDGKVVVE